MSRTLMSGVAALVVLGGGLSCGSERATPPRDVAGAMPLAAQPADPAAAPALASGTALAETNLTASTPAPSDSGAAAPTGASQARPASKPGRITIEGFDEWLKLDRFDAPRGFPLPFTTYAPSDLLAEGTAAAIRFVANFGSHRNDAVVLELRPLDAGVSESAARESARREAARRGRVAAGESGRFAWSVAEYAYAGRTPVGPGEGLVALGRHGDRYFMVLLDYPPEYSEGFLPRVNRMLQELRWSDTGTGLHRSS